MPAHKNGGFHESTHRHRLFAELTTCARGSCRTAWPLDTDFFVLNVVDVQRFARLPALIDNTKLPSWSTPAPSSFFHSGHKALAEIRMDFPRKVISDCAKELQADLIMVGSHDHSAIGRFLLGSIAQAVT